MTSHFYVGVDGGATKAVVRLEDAEGKLLGRIIGPPANIRLSVDKAWAGINDVLCQLLQSHGLSLNHTEYQFHVGMGLAGCEVSRAYDAFLKHDHSFQTLVLSTDAHAACVGAHGGEDGSIIISGTGAVGYQQFAGTTSKVSGWGFPHDDQGSGAWIALQAIQATLRAMDARQPWSSLTKKIYAHFDSKREVLVGWLDRADSTMYATLTPIVLTESTNENKEAQEILIRAAAAIDAIHDALIAAQPGSQRIPCVLLGGVAPFLEPYLKPTLKSRLTTAKSTPDAGAIQLVRNYLTSAGSMI